MAAALSIVQPTDRTETLMSRTFTEEFIARLEALNRVARELRAMGYRIVSESVGDERPTIAINPGTARTTLPLVKLGHGSLIERQPDGSRVCSMTRDGVRVVWREAACAKAESV